MGSNPGTASAFRRPLWLSLGLAAGVFLVFGRLTTFGFINYDDEGYVTSNPFVQRGLSQASAAWAFTTFSCANWHPLTWLSLQLDHELLGLDAAGFHLTNVLLHAANTVLLFLVLRQITGAVSRSALVAALFAFHPLHVESVAWVSERKDVLSTFFGLLALWSYGCYALRPGLVRYLGVVLGLVLSLLAKPMLVTLPFVLLLLDYWPLQRLHTGSLTPPSTNTALVSLRRLLAEKVPLLLVVAASCVMTVWAQGSAGAIQSLDAKPFAMRTANAVVAYVAYLRQTIWPADLGLFYSYTKATWLQAQTILSALLLLGVSAACIVEARRRPYLPVGWFWYLGMLVPVIGLVQVGGQAHADRYTYVPLIGIFLLGVWGAGELAERWNVARVVRVAAAACVLLACVASTWVQAGYWRSSVAIWQHTLAVTGPSLTTCQSLGRALLRQGHEAAALPYLQKAVELAPQDEDAHYHLSQAYARLGRYTEAIAELSTAIRLNPAHDLVDSPLIQSLSREARFDDVQRKFAQAAQRDPRPFAAAPPSDHILLAWELLQLHKVRAERDLFERGAK
jgi:tetratricopeptide (TPR) repeat protein